ncbi:cytochrome [Arthrobacter alpinus]|uniref:Cytochrome n=1 Tax=Arthrobacter alpinus TaxID=656366 RepID=A0A0M4RQC5_9MICC|nr:cytochrome P450 [Arthrobacter alpinus]ALE92863.1 cytochrome [Arthrobacter alpinus]
MSHTVIGEPSQVREIMRRTDDFAPTNALTSVVSLAPATLRVLSRVRFALPPVLASATGEQHRAVRSMVGRFFTPATVAGVGPRVRELARVRLAAAGTALERGPVDLAETVARHIPPIVMAELTGQPTPELDVLKRWSQDSLELFWGWPDPDRQLVLASSAAEFYVWLRREAAAARGTGSLFGVLDAAGLAPAEVCSLGYFLVIAGQETTSQLINTALFRGIEFSCAGPAASESVASESAGRWAALANPEAARAHVRRVLATESSVHTWRRAALRDTCVAGTAFPAGAEILLELTGRHPDEAGPTAYSLAFGHGLHRCLGAKLAELETALVVEETARALPALTLVGEQPQWLRLLSFQAPLTVTVAKQTRGAP